MIAFILLVAELKEGALLLVSIAAVIAAGVMLANWAVAALRAILKTPDQPTCDASGTAQVVQQIREEP